MPAKKFTDWRAPAGLYLAMAASGLPTVLPESLNGHRKENTEALPALRSLLRQPLVLFVPQRLAERYAEILTFNFALSTVNFIHSAARLATI